LLADSSFAAIAKTKSFENLLDIYFAGKTMVEKTWG